MEYLSLEELSNELSISVATAKNWLRLGKINFQKTKGNTKYFSREYLDKLLVNIRQSDDNVLKSRRNKNYIKGNFFYKDYVPSSSKNIKTVESLLNTLSSDRLADEDYTKYIVADCAIQLLVQAKKISSVGENFLLNYLENKLNLGFYSQLIDFFIEDKNKAILFINKFADLFQFNFVYEKNEDLLGLLYLSCSNMNKRKQCGMYYTPTKVVQLAIENLLSKNEITKEDKILDCCCGTGNFLLNLPDSVKLEQIYGNDIDIISSHITKINLALKHDIKDLKILDNNITNWDFLTEYNQADFNYIIGNPPWGYCFSKAQKENLSKNYLTAQKENVESFDLFIEKSLSVLKKDGILTFVLPESVLNVKSHIAIRQIIKDNNSIQYINYLGNIFDGVHCPGIVLQIKHTKSPMLTSGMVIGTEKNLFEISTQRDVNIDNFNFKICDNEYKLLKKILDPQNKKYLKGNAEFALGIVTGNNKLYLSPKKSETNEVIIKGSDISPYKINDGKNFITYDKKLFQQSAPLEMYRACEKLVYKFISNKFAFAYDDNKRLTLNSCNILIPKIKGMDIKYILAVLNSSVAQFVYQKEFNSVKVLRSHLEKIPIPICQAKVQQEITQFVNAIIAAEDMECYKNLYDTLDDKISQLYGLNYKECLLIKESIV